MARIRASVNFSRSVITGPRRADAAAALRECGVRLVEPEPGAYDAIVLAVAHRAYREAGAAALHAYGKPGAHVFFDVKAVLPASESDGRL